jgi:hypothetical protein
MENQVSRDLVYDVSLRIDFDSEEGCHGGCGTYEIVVRHPVAPEDANCCLDSLIVYDRVDGDYPSCCGGKKGKVEYIYIDHEIPDDRLSEAITVYDFLSEFADEVIRE